MKKLLATGLIASVAVASTESSASCGNGGFYVGVNFGMAFTKLKATNKAKDDYADGDLYGSEELDWHIGAIQYDEKLISKAAAEKRSALAVDNALQNSKKKIKSLAELVLGYDFRLNDVMIGVELNAGGIFGTTRMNRPEFTIAATDTITNNGGAAIYPDAGGDDCQIPDRREYAKLKEQWHIALMPRVGYLFTPQFEGYVTFGVKLAKYKTEVDDLPFCANIHDQGNDRDLDNELLLTTMKKKATKAVFIAGAGVRYEINPSWFTKLEYNFEFGVKPKLHKEAMPELKKVKVTSHTIKLGLGRRF